MTGGEAFAVVIGVALFVAGFVLLALARRLNGSRSWPGVGLVSTATETSAGFALVFAGYHVVAYGGPSGWVTFRVPPDLGWVVFAACGAMVIGSVAADRALGGAADEAGEDDGA